jgi:hypothetical protein
VHGHHQATAPAVSLPPATAATPSRGPSGDPKDAHGVPMDFFVDPASGWTCWIPRWPTEAEAAANEGPTAARRPRGQGLVVGLLGRVGAWFGIAEQTPSGGWRRVHVPRRDPWEPDARHSCNTWSWWC